MDELLQATITIDEVGLEDKRLKVVAGGKVYSIWRTKKDGSQTKAYTDFSPFALQAQGKQWTIQYDEKPNPQNAGTFYRTIYTIQPSTGAPVQTSQASQTISGKDLLDRIKSLELRVSVLEGKNSVNVPTEPQNATQVPNLPPQGTAQTVSEGHPDYIDVNDIPF